MVCYLDYCSLEYTSLPIHITYIMYRTLTVDNTVDKVKRDV
jgi:hypothetical protein